MPEFLVPFKGRNQTSMFGVNVLWRERNVYIMDNHRCALWCWLQEIPGEDRLSVFHVDAHYDLAWDWCPAALDVLRRVDLAALPISEYLALQIPWGGYTRLAVADDNFLALFLALNPGRTENLCFTPGPDLCGDFPTQEILCRAKHVEPVNPWELLHRTRTDRPGDPRWIFDVDLDFFFCRRNSEDDRVPLFSDLYVEAFFDAIAEALKRDRIAVLTVSLSPDFCGGWPNSEKLCASLCQALGLDFRFPI